jgi:hypothetical protein
MATKFDFESEAKALGLMEAPAPSGDVEGMARELGLEELPEDTGQSRLSSAGFGILKGAGQFFTRGAEGVGGILGMLSPINYLPKMGIDAPKVDESSAASRWLGDPGKQITAIGKAGTEAVDKAIATNPAYQEEFWAGQAPQAIGQVLGLLGETLATRGINTVPLIHTGLVGLASGYDEADRQGVTDQAKRDAMAASYGLSEALVERLGGVGSSAFTKRLFDVASRRGGESFVKRMAKTALTEGVEEPITGELQDISANVFGGGPLADPPSYDLSDPEVLKRRATEFALGAVAGAPVGALDAVMSRRAPQSTEAGQPDTDTGPPVGLQEQDATPDQVDAAYAELYGADQGPSPLLREQEATDEQVQAVYDELNPDRAGFTAPEKDLATPQDILPIEARYRRDKALRAMSNEELAETLSWAQTMPDPEWQEAAQQLSQEAERRANQQVTNRQDSMDDGVPVEDGPVVPEGTPIIPNLPSLRGEGGFVEPLAGAELSAQVIEDGVSAEEKVRQSALAAEALKADLRSRETIIPEAAVEAPAKAVSSPSAASSPASAPTTLPAPQDAPAAKETPKAAPSAPEALDAVADAEKTIAMAKRMGYGPGSAQMLMAEKALAKAKAAVSSAKIPVVMPDGSVAAAPAVVNGAQGLEPNLAPVSSVAAEEAKAANIREAQEKEKQEAAKVKQKEADEKKAEAEKKKAEKSQLTEGTDKPVTYKMKDYNKTGRVGKGVELPIEQARAKLLQRQSLFNSLKNCLEGKA